MADTSRSLRITALIVGLAVLVMHARVVLGGKTWDDVRYHTEVAPPRFAAADAVLAGEAPTWWEGSALGVPLLGEPSHGAAYPLTWLGATPLALDLLAVLHLFWLALGVAWWARRLGASELASVVSGVLAAASGIAITSALHGALPALAHFAWVGWAATGLASRRGAALLGLSLGAIGLTGQAAMFVDAVVLAVVLGARAGTLRWLGLALLGGFAIASAQWIPALAIAGDTAGAAAYRLELWRLLEVIVPLGPSSLFIGAPMLALAALGRPSIRVLAVAPPLVVAAVVTGHAEQHLAVLGVLAAAHAGAGFDVAVDGARRAFIALGAAVVVTAAALAAAWAIDGAVVLACLAAAIVVVWRHKNALAFAALIVAPSVGSLRTTAPVIDRSIVDTPPLWADAALKATDTANPRAPLRVYRPISLYEDEPAPDVGDAISTFVGASSSRYGLAAARSEDPARPALHDKMWLASSSVGGAFLERYGISLAILPSSMVVGRGLTELSRRGNWMLAKFPATPPAAMIFEWLWLPDDAATIARLFPPGAGRGLPAGVAILRGTGRAQQDEPRAPEPCTVTRWARGAIDLTCASEEPSYGVVSSTNARGWTVEVDGKETPWVVADVMRRAVELSPGAHVVSWRYAAPGLVAGVVLAALGLVLLVVLLVLRVTRPPAPDAN